ncbi:MAG: phosphomannomutase/phosphoglucomutase [Clostridia bacterium]|nr:phosphomannomutase/phosphoglucomutase [Clostridia bacterium]
MLTQEWKRLKSGTDIRGVAVETPGSEVTLTDDVVARIACGFAKWLSAKKQKNVTELKISIGHDSRISADRVREAAANSLYDMGVTVFDCMLSSTPAMFMTTVELGCDGAIEITASHHPFDRNGLKFFTREGGLDSQDISDILLYAQENDFNLDECGVIVGAAYMSIYCKRLREMICREINDENDYEQPLKGLKIVVDAGNGAGGFYATEVLEPLGADITGSLYLEPDGYFPNHIPNPENKVAMRSIVKATLDNGADLGIIFDTDVDRAGCVDKNGKEINRNALVALASVIALENNAGGTIVTDSITSSGLKEFIEKDLGGKHHRFKRGYRKVINESLRLNAEGINSPLAIETSGHAAFRDNYFLDDGAYLITKIVIKTALMVKQGKTVGDLISTLRQPLENTEVRMNILAPDFAEYGNMVIEKLKEYAQQRGLPLAPENYEGVRIETQGGWMLLRLSVHDPIMPLNIESDYKGGVKELAAELYEFIKDFDGVDSSALKAMISE